MIVERGRLFDWFVGFGVFVFVCLFIGVFYRGFYGAIRGIKFKVLLFGLEKKV